ncbi:glycerophosphodiester phosphodiesterase family protein [Tabrizicola sp. BL-A-41-H6]|uniref:glycerophosphodiester phosphodiesterase family protein n=1 Tax=Tabrizicola sp. BL-A-41-H6 TaxID=3421107 RepID=UPI003D66ED5B
MRVPLPAGFLSLPIAHRALHDRAQRRPENSLGAIRAAIAAGYGIEIDIQLSSDGVPIVFHDDELDRLTGETGPVSDHPAKELTRIPLRDCDETIPTLAQTLAIVAGRVPLLIEIKDQTHAMSDTDGRFEAAIAALLSLYQGPVAVMSFNPFSVAHMARFAPGLPRGLTTSAYDPADWAPLSPETCARLREIPDFDRTLSSFISHEAADLSRERVADLKASGATILCWTIRSPEAEAEARRIAQNVTFEGYLPRTA